MPRFFARANPEGSAAPASQPNNPVVSIFEWCDRFDSAWADPDETQAPAFNGVVASSVSGNERHVSALDCKHVAERSTGWAASQPPPDMAETQGETTLEELKERLSLVGTTNERIIAAAFKYVPPAASRYDPGPFAHECASARSQEEGAGDSSPSALNPRGDELEKGGPRTGAYEESQAWTAAVSCQARGRGEGTRVCASSSAVARRRAVRLCAAAGGWTRSGTVLAA